MPNAEPQIRTPSRPGMTPAVLARTLQEGEPPSEWRLFKAGRNDTDKGVLYFTADSALTVMEIARRWGNEYSFDYEHSAIFGMEAPAAAWYQLETRDTEDGPELWASNIRWTPKADEYIKNREYRYLSPWVWVDESGVVVEYINGALTNLPATRNMDALIAASKGLDPRKAGSKEDTMSTDNARLMTALGLRPDASVESAVEALEPLRQSHQTMQALSRILPEGKDPVGTITAWRDQAAKADELQQTLAKQERDQADAKVQQLLDQGVKDGKLTPASRDGLVKALSTEDGHIEPGRVEAYLATVPKGSHAVNHRQPAGNADTNPTDPGDVDADGKTEYERIVAKSGHKALAKLRTDDPDRFNQVLSAHRRARYGSN